MAESDPRGSGQVTQLDRAHYDIDLEVYDRFVGFSAEIVRLSLATLAAVGFGLSLFGQDRSGQFHSAWVRWPLAFSLIILALAVASALAHRYFSSEGFYYHARMLRRREVGLSRSQMELNYKRAEKLLILSFVLLAFGALMVGVSFFFYVSGLA